MRNSIDYQLVADRVGDIQTKISSKSTNRVTIVAVTKGFSVEAIRAVNKAGIYDIGESYAQEMLAKQSLLDGAEVEGSQRWHFVGNLQRNKVKKLFHNVFMWQSVDSMALGEEIAKRCETPKLLVQVNMTGSLNQGGAPPSEAPALVERLQELEIDVAGLMTIGDHADREATLGHFLKLKKMSKMLNLPECSMGMSNDYDLALEAGATILRLGTAIFGNRDDD